MNKYVVLIRDGIRGGLLCSVETHEQEDIDWLELDEIVDDALLTPKGIEELYAQYDNLKITLAKVLKEEWLHYPPWKTSNPDSYMDDLYNAIRRYKENRATEPKHIVIPMKHRQAIKILSGVEGKELTEFMGIPVISSEDTIVIRER